MLNSNKVTMQLSILTIGFILFSIFIAFTNTMILWFLLIFILSIMFIYKKRSQISKKDIIVGLLLSVITMISNAFMGVFVFLTYVASVTILKKSNNQIILYNRENKNELRSTLINIFLFGGILACLNIALALGTYQIDVSFRLQFIFDALRAGIFEEIIFRMFLFSLCIEFTGNVLYTKSQETWCYLLMVLPHVLMHFNGTIDFMSVIILSIAFGLPLSLMQRKLNLFSAICAHSMIDFVRFVILGV